MRELLGEAIWLETLRGSSCEPCYSNLSQRSLLQSGKQSCPTLKGWLLGARIRLIMPHGRSLLWDFQTTDLANDTLRAGMIRRHVVIVLATHMLSITCTSTCNKKSIRLRPFA